MADIKDTIVKKALRCIDEVLPDPNTLNEAFYPTEAFIDEAVHWVIDVAPAHRLGKGVVWDYVDEMPDITLSEDGVVRISIPGEANFARILNIMLPDWQRPVTSAINDTDPLYKQQQNRVLRGNPSRPTVALCNSRTILELYSTRCTLSEIKSKGRFVVIYYNIDQLPPAVYDLTAWKLAEIVLLSMSDTTAAAICTARTNELLQQLVL
jgi:hypothetical protein